MPYRAQRQVYIWPWSQEGHVVRKWKTIRVISVCCSLSCPHLTILFCSPPGLGFSNPQCDSGMSNYPQISSVTVE